MSVATSIAAITDSRNTIRNKMVALGIGLSTDKLADLATKLAATVDNGAVDVSIVEGETYTIPAGWHNGSGTVTGVAGGGDYELQAKTCTPTKAQQNITPDMGKYGLSSVTVDAIPAAYQDVSSTTATAADVKAGSVFVAADGTTTTGTMPVNAAQTINVTVDDEQTLTAGYYAGITINGPTLSGDAVAANVLAGKTFYSDSGTQITGTMSNQGAVAGSIDGLTSMSYTIPAGYHDGTGTVTLTSDIEDALSAI